MERFFGGRVPSLKFKGLLRAVGSNDRLIKEVRFEPGAAG